VAPSDIRNAASKFSAISRSFSLFKRFASFNEKKTLQNSITASFYAKTGAGAPGGFLWKSSVLRLHSGRSRRSAGKILQ
jgi:hypothetical protein